MASFKYSVDDEKDPEDPFHSDAFQSSLVEAQELVTKIRDCLAKGLANLQEGSALLRLLQECIRLSNFTCSDKRTIGIVGNTGQGKSSLVNALLDEKDLALTGAFGKAVTPFVTEYLYCKKDQTAPYSIMIECLTGRELDEHIQELLDQYRKIFLSSASELTPTELEVAEDISFAAEQVFRTALGLTATSVQGASQPYPGLDLEAMKAEHEGAYDEILGQLLQLGHALSWPSGMKDGLWTAEAHKASEVNELLTPFIDQGLWVLVKITRIFLKSTVLKSGIVLADLPGYYDVNFARMKAAKKFQGTCDEIFVVSDIKRAIDDPVIREVIKDHCTRRTDFGQLTHPHLTVVCTHSADIDATENLKKHVPPDRLLNATKQEAEASKQSSENNAAWKKVQKEAKFHTKSLLIAVRNQMVKDDLKQKYAAYFEPGYLPVYCVDNRLYHKCHNKHAAIVSGIPELRTFCRSILAKTHFRAATRYLDELSSLVSSIGLWIKAAHNPGMQSLAMVLSAQPLSKHFEWIKKGWQEAAEDALDRLMEKHNEKMYEAIAGAIRTCESWKKMHPSSFRAWIRNNGTHWTRTIGYKCWNAELIENLNRTMAQYWMSLDNGVATSLDWCLEQTKIAMNELIADAKNATAPPGFITNVQAQELRLGDLIRCEFKALQNKLGATKRDAISANAASHIATLMRPTYRRCQHDFGSGVTGRNRTEIHRYVSSRKSGLFPELLRTIKENLDENAQQHWDEIAGFLDEVLKAIQTDLLTINVPDTAFVDKHPRFANSVVEMHNQAEQSLRALQAKAAGPIESARQLEWI